MNEMNQNPNTEFKNSVFVVDDSEDVVDLFKLLARQNNFSLVSACNGQEALQKLASLKSDPSIVFVDLNMPVMNGAEFLHRIQETGLAASSQIVIFSGYEKDDVDNLDKSLSWLKKPFTLNDVMDAINQARLH